MLGPGNQHRTRDCSLLAVFLADLETSKRIPRIHALEKEWGHRYGGYLSTMPTTTAFLLNEGHAATLLKQSAAAVVAAAKNQAMPQMEPIQVWATKQTALVAQSFLLAAASHGVATSPMEGFDANRLKEILSIPDRYHIPLVVATGYAEEQDKEKPLTPRLPLEEVVFEDSFGEPITFEENKT